MLVLCVVLLTSGRLYLRRSSARRGVWKQQAHEGQQQYSRHDEQKSYHDVTAQSSEGQHSRSVERQDRLGWLPPAVCVRDGACRCLSDSGVQAVLVEAVLHARAHAGGQTYADVVEAAEQAG